MQIQINFGDVRASDALDSHIRTELDRNIGRFADRITRVEVHINDLNGHKNAPNDKRCLIEARPAGHDPFVVENIGDDFFAVVTGGAHKLERILDRHFDKLNAHHTR